MHIPTTYPAPRPGGRHRPGISTNFLALVFDNCNLVRQFPSLVHQEPAHSLGICYRNPDLSFYCCPLTCSPLLSLMPPKNKLSKKLENREIQAQEGSQDHVLDLSLNIWTLLKIRQKLRLEETHCIAASSIPRVNKSICSRIQMLMRISLVISNSAWQISPCFVHPPHPPLLSILLT